MKSTVPVGTGAQVRHRLDERGLERVGYVSNPEFTAEGTAIRDFQQPDRIVIGAFDDADGDAVEELHRGIDAPIVRCDVASAEMIKLAANAALMTRISFINEIANVCEATGADVVRVAEGVGLDRRIGSSFLRAGIGYGGSCFPKDSLALKQLAANSGYHFQLLNAVIEVNELQKRRVIGKLQQHLGSLRGKTVALLGLAFKPNTDDMREAPSLVLAGRLVAEGAEVRAWDPVADGCDGLHGVDQVEPLEEALARRRRGRARDGVARARRASTGRDAPPRACGTPLLRRRPQHARSRRACAQSGFVYEGIGRAPGRLSSEPSRGDPRRRPRHPAAAADRPDAEGHAAARRPAAARVHVRASAAVRRHPRDRLVRLPADADPGALRRPRTATSGSSTGSRRSRSAPAARSASRREGIDGPFFALNGDSLRETDLDALVDFHRDADARATILLTPVEDPSRYGLVRVQRRRSRAQLPREAAAGGDRHEPDQRRPLRARAGRARPDPAGPGRVDRARGLSAARRGGGRVRRGAARATGSTSARPRPTSRRTATCSSGTSSPSSATRSAPTTRSSPRERR